MLDTAGVRRGHELLQQLDSCCSAIHSFLFSVSETLSWATVSTIIWQQLWGRKVFFF
jgi:hypothetical protein